MSVRLALTVRTISADSIEAERSTVMSALTIKPPKNDAVVIKGYEDEDIDVSVEQLETRLVPESIAGFLE